MDSKIKLQSSYKKQQDKWIEGQVKKFCECAVPHHINLLKEHKVTLYKVSSYNDNEILFVCMTSLFMQNKSYDKLFKTCLSSKCRPT